jgi:hypothetical protein
LSRYQVSGCNQSALYTDMYLKPRCVGTHFANAEFARVLFRATRRLCVYGVSLPTSGYFALRSTKFCFRCALPTGVGDIFTVGQSRERFQSNVNSDGILKGGEGLGFALHRKTRIPLMAFALRRKSSPKPVWCRGA